jgi:transcription antitermination factor NusG
VVRTRQHWEGRVIEALEELRVGHYLPMERKLATRNRRTRAVDRPLLPRYLFARVEDRSDYRTVLTTEGVDDCLRNPERRPYLLCDEDVLELSLRQEIGDFDTTAGGFYEGQVVNITGGPFQGFTAEIVRAKACDRVLILMGRFLGRQSKPFQIDAHMLEAA